MFAITSSRIRPCLIHTILNRTARCYVGMYTLLYIYQNTRIDRTVYLELRLFSTKTKIATYFGVAGSIYICIDYNEAAKLNLLNTFSLNMD